MSPLYRKLLYICLILAVGIFTVSALLAIKNDGIHSVVASVISAFDSSATALAAPAKAPDQNIHVLFVGDMMFDRAVRKTVNSNGYDFVFGDAKTLFDKTRVNGPDLVVGNLEGSITTFPSRTLLARGSTGNGNGPLDFTFATPTAPALRSTGVDVVSLANNHSANRGDAGLTQTRKYLTAAGVEFFGDPGNISKKSIIKCVDTGNAFAAASTTTKNICIGLIGYHEFAYKNDDTVIEDIKTLKEKTDIIIVMPHWGIEYKKTPSKLQRSLAHQWIDTGADIVVGAHPHVVESIEEYNGHKIFYSLGNFIFDQYFSFDTTHGLAVDISIPKNYSKEVSATATSTTNINSISFNLIPTENKNTVMSFPNASTTTYILNDLANSSTKYVSTSTKESIRTGRI